MAGEAQGFEGPPLTARSVVASMLLGTHPPRLPPRALVAAGELFGISDGAVRTALSRLVANGEAELVDGWYALTGPLLDRQARQDRSRDAPSDSWDGTWTMAVVRDERRSAARRTVLRDAMRRLGFAQLREGVWMRPSNLDIDRLADDAAVVRGQCLLFASEPDEPARDLAARLWDLDGWADTARSLGADLDRRTPDLERGDTSELRDAFVLSAAVLRHLVHDPLLPPAALPDDWPGESLRGSYARFDLAFKVLLRQWLDERKAETS